MGISEETVAAVVADVSERLSDPAYTQLSVGSFVEEQPDISRFLSAKMQRIGGGQAVIVACFHAQVLSECLRRDRGIEVLERVNFATLDEVSGEERLKALQEEEPALADYVISNVEEEALRDGVAHVGLALVRGG